MKIAFVAPFCGSKAAGGAESECLNTAIHLARAGCEVEILTTCALDLQHNWNVNYYRQGSSQESGVFFRRFRTEGTDLTQLFSLNNKLLKGEILSASEEEQFIAMHVNSFGLYRYIAENESMYDWICFIPYLFGTTFFGSMLCPKKAVLIPCFHNESYARMKVFSDLFNRVSKVVFHTKAEEVLANELYGSLKEKSLLIGEGVETNFASDDDRFRKKYEIKDPFILYAGRKDRTKNIHTLIHYFSMYKENNRNNLRLIMIGPGQLPIPSNMKENILDFGFVPEQDKKDAYSAASIFCQPSLNESFSIVMMEAWNCSIPCLVHGGCSVTSEHVVDSGGGLYFTNYDEFEGCLNYFLSNSDMTLLMGRAGREYVQECFSWNKIVKRYLEEVFV